MTNILEIPDQYFYVWDRDRHEAIEISLLSLSYLRENDTEERRRTLEDRLKLVFGFREARILAYGDIRELEERLREKDERQQHMRAYLRERFEAKAAEVVVQYPADFGEREIKRDAVFYTLARSGMMAITEAIGQSNDWEKSSGEILDGKTLDQFLPSKLIESVIDFLPSAILFNNQRAELRQRLRQYGIPDEQVEKIEGKLPKPVDLADLLTESQQHDVQILLEDCATSETDYSVQFGRLAEKLGLEGEKRQQLDGKLRKIVGGPVFQLAKSVNGLRYGRVNESVLSYHYRAPGFYSFFPFGAELSKLEMKVNKIEHVHNHSSTSLNNFFTNNLIGKRGLTTKLIDFLSIEDITSWQAHGGFSLLDPVLQPQSVALGEYIGYFLFGHGHSTGRDSFMYSIDARRSSEWFLNLLEKTGRLVTEPFMRTGESSIGTKTFKHRSYLIPKQYISLATYVLSILEERNHIEIAKYSLVSWLDDRGTIAKKGKRYLVALLKPEYEQNIRRMADTVGLHISEGSVQYNKKKVSINNPEVIGYNPELK